MPQWYPQTPDKNPFTEEHEHQSIIWDARTASYICTTCGLVLTQWPHPNPSPESSLMEVKGRPSTESRNAWLDREIVEAGSIILEQDLMKLNSQQRELFQRLYRAQLRVISSWRQDRRRSEFDRFLQRLTKYKAFRIAFPPHHPKLDKLLDTFLKCCQNYAVRHGRHHGLQNSTKIRIFLALIQPHLNSKIFQEIVTRVAETTTREVYKVAKKIGCDSNCASVNLHNLQRKSDFIDNAIQLVKDAPIDPETKKRAEDILIKRARVNGLITRKRPATLAAAALFVAASHGTPEHRISKNKAQQLVGASYIPTQTIDDCRKILEMKDERFERMESQKLLMTYFTQREDLLATRRLLRSRLVKESKKAFPELGKILKLRNVSTLKFLKQYPSTVEIAKLEREELINFLKTHSQGKLRNVDKLASRLLIEARKNETIGRRRPRPGNQTVIRSLVFTLEKIKRHRLELERKMRLEIGEKGRALIRTPGIGLITATIMILSKNRPISKHAVANGKSFIHHRLLDAIRVLQRNRQLRHQYLKLFNQKVPRVATVPYDIEQLLQITPPLPEGL
ncbi:MAG: hypothetical protein ACE5R6_01935 [Candidatus Heimdallarchaeota archaeon]